MTNEKNVANNDGNTDETLVANAQPETVESTEPETVESTKAQPPAQGAILTGSLVSEVKEGKDFVLVNLVDGFTGILHESQLAGSNRDERSERLRGFEAGQEVEVSVRSVKPSETLKQGVRIELSERPIVARQRRQEQAAFAETLVVGQSVSGAVCGFLTERGEDGKKVGAFVRFGESGLRGLVHISQMPGADNDAQRAALEALAEGQELIVAVTKVDSSDRGPQVALSLKRLAQEEFVGTLEAGSIVSGVVAGFLTKGDDGRKYRVGAFVSLPQGLRGLVHVSEFPGSDRRERNQALDAITEGEEIEVTVLKAESVNRIALSLASQDNGDHAARLTSRDKVKGRVLGSRDGSYEIDLGQGITGLLPLSALGASLCKGGNVWVKVESVAGSTATCSRQGI